MLYYCSLTPSRVPILRGLPRGAGQLGVDAFAGSPTLFDCSPADRDNTQTFAYFPY